MNSKDYFVQVSVRMEFFYNNNDQKHFTLLQEQPKLLTK